MLALLSCTERSCRASFEAEGTRRAIAELRCEDCGSELKATGWADGDPDAPPAEELNVRRAA